MTPEVKDERGNYFLLEHAVRRWSAAIADGHTSSFTNPGRRKPLPSLSPTPAGASRYHGPRAAVAKRLVRAERLGKAKRLVRAKRLGKAKSLMRAKRLKERDEEKTNTRKTCHTTLQTIHPRSTKLT